jgi:DNA-binding MarR family transcriptional regulator
VEWADLPEQVMIKHEISSLAAREVWSLLDRTGFAVSRLRELELAVYGLTIEQASLLYFLSTAENLTATSAELESCTMRQHHSISVLSAGMAAAGLLQKIKSPASKRLKIVMTPYGLTTYQKTTAASLKESFAALNGAEWQLLNNIMILLLRRARTLLGLPEDSARCGDSHSFLHDSWVLLDRTRFAISRLRSLELARFGLTIEQTSILHITSKNNEIVTSRELENLTMRRQHSISSLLKGMTGLGLVSREKNEGEKRSRILITKTGRKLYQSLTFDSLESVFSVLSQAEKQNLTALLERLLARARYLLGISYKPPFMQYLVEDHPKLTV